MKFTYEDQVQFAKLALTIFDAERDDVSTISTLYDFGSLVMRHANEENGVIYDVGEYLYEQLRLLKGEDGAYDDPKLRDELDALINGPDNTELERNLEQQVLAKYDLPPGTTTWLSHDRIGLDDVAHYFTRGTKYFVLVWNDFRGNEDFIHDEHLPPVKVIGGTDEWLHITTGDRDFVGYYSLYRDRKFS